MNVDYQFHTGMPNHSWIVPVLTLICLFFFRRTQMGIPLLLSGFGILGTFVLFMQGFVLDTTNTTAMTQAISNTYKVGTITIDEKPDSNTSTDSQLYQLTIVNSADNKAYSCRFTTISHHAVTTKRFPELQKLQQVHGQLLCNDSAVVFQHK